MGTAADGTPKDETTSTRRLTAHRMTEGREDREDLNYKGCVKQKGKEDSHRGG